MPVILLGGRPGTPPNGIAGLQLWFAADQGVYNDAGVTLATDGQTVQQWNDFSANAHNLSQGTAGARPTYHANGGSNDRPYLAFDAVNDTMSRSANDDDNLIVNNAFTFFAIWRHAAAGVGNIPKVFVLNDGVNPVIVAQCNNTPQLSTSNFDGTQDTVNIADSNNTWQIHSGMHSGGNIFVGKNDARTTSLASTASGNTSFGANTNLIVANYNSSFSGMDIAEIVFYNVALSEPERLQLEAYFAWKYGIALPY